MKNTKKSPPQTEKFPSAADQSGCLWVTIFLSFPDSLFSGNGRGKTAENRARNREEKQRREKEKAAGATFSSGAEEET